MRGWVRVYSYSEPPDALLQHRLWQLRKPGEEDSLQPRQVLQGQWDGNVLRAQLEGIEDRDAAMGLREWEILIERSALPAAAEREYYREDLLGFTVRNREGAVLGELKHFLETAASPVMVIKGEREYTVPAEPTYLKRVDLARRELEVDWPADF